MLALTFVFGDSVKSVFESALFLFLEHPYDVGDTLVMAGGVLCKVKKIDLMYTVSHCRYSKQQRRFCIGGRQLLLLLASCHLVIHTYGQPHHVVSCCCSSNGAAVLSQMAASAVASCT